MKSTIEVDHTISMGHRLPSYKGICSSPHGHNAVFTVEVETHDFLDFKEVSNNLQEILQDLDHAMVLQSSDPLLEVLNDMQFRVVALNCEPTTEAIAQHVFNEMLERHSGTTQVTMQETAKYRATIVEYNPNVVRMRVVPAEAHR